MNNYPEPIIKSVKLLCEELKKHYPEVFKQAYDSLGKPTIELGNTFESRMCMGVYIELIKAGAGDKLNED